MNTDAVVQVVHRVVHALMVDVADIVPLARRELGREPLTEGLAWSGADDKVRVLPFGAVGAVLPLPRSEEECKDRVRCPDGAGDDVPAPASSVDDD